LDNCDNVDKNVWADVQREFLAAYAPSIISRTTCTNFQDLVQRQGENSHDYYLSMSIKPSFSTVDNRALASSVLAIPSVAMAQMSSIVFSLASHILLNDSVTLR
jgi:hypothetical protein